jgi:hypothetical protein
MVAVRKNRSIFTGSLGLFWIYFYGFMGNAWLCRAQSLEIGRETNEMEKKVDMVVGFADLISAPLVHRTARKRHSLLSFSYVCPEPVLAKRSFSLYKTWAKRRRSFIFSPVAAS